MKRTAILLAITAAVWTAGCNHSRNEAAEAPPPAVIEHVEGVRLISVDHPELFPVVAAQPYQSFSALHVTGVVNPDVSRTIPVISLASGRVVEIRAHLGDYVAKGQLLMRVSSGDIATAYSTYRKALADQALAKDQLQRAVLLYGKGAIAKSALEIAQDTADKAAVDVETSAQSLRVLGVRNPDGPQKDTVDIYAPASGVIVQQNVTNAAAAGMTFAGSSTAYVIADLSHVWILCDVYENDLSMIHVGQTADVRLDAYPGRQFQGTISDISPILDPSLRTAKVRIQLPNPGGLMKVGMFATATIQGNRPELHVSVPATAILHLHDRDWVYEPADHDRFQRIGVVSGAMLPGGLQEVVSGLQAGQRVVTNALELENTVNP